jgi:DNA-binding CsgD family transcriptional regulator
MHGCRATKTGSAGFARPPDRYLRFREAVERGAVKPPCRLSGIAVKDEKAIHSLIGTIYLCGSGNAEWQVFLDQYAKLFPALKFGLTGYDRSFSDVEVFCTSNYDLSFIEAYAAHYYKINAWKDLILNSPQSPHVGWGHQAVPVPQLEKTEFYADWLRPQENIATGFTTMLFNEPNRIVNLAVNVNPKHIEEAEAAAEAMSVIGPHLQRSFELYRQLLGRRVQEDSYQSVLNLLAGAVFVVDAKGKIRLANAKGDRMLAQERVVKSDGAGGLRFLHVGDHQAVMESVRRATTLSDAGGRRIIPLRAEQGRRYFALVALLWSQPREPIMRGSQFFAPPVSIAVFVVDSKALPCAEIDHIAVALRVTPAEARLAQALLHDKTLNDFADKAGISVHTARVQLRSLLDKTDTRRQSQLVRLLANAFGGLDWGGAGGR